MAEKHYGAEREFHRIRADTMVGMGFSNLIAISIIVTAAATLNATGETDIETPAQAAEALKPIAGAFAEFIFALGIIGTGLLAVPVMILLMFLARRRDVMSKFIVAGPLYWLGWLSTGAMTVCVIAMIVGFFSRVF